MLKSTAAGLLCAALLVSTVGAASPYYQDTKIRYNTFRQAASLQADTETQCPMSGAMEVCQSAQLMKGNQETDYLHVCPRDGIRINLVASCMAF